MTKRTIVLLAVLFLFVGTISRGRRSRSSA